ncbi:MAG TPA: phosphomannomutase/phosphoglucomutase [Candidatus Paceibacterota bacterium]|nr:phosphomannomutase/phosphoglucomutase [Candidatus Paceibacterota bacterium]
MGVFRAYDIRGVYGQDLTDDLAFAVGQAAARFLKAKKMVVGRDARTSSEPLTAKVIAGITSVGCDVIDIGETTTPLFYFSVNTFKTEGGIMITASHNPAQYNGLKIVGPEAVPIGSETGLKEIERLSGEPAVAAPDSGRGGVDHEKLIDDYINLIIEMTGATEQNFGEMRIVADASNGMASLMLKNLFKKINVNVIPLHWDIDETFPHHGPDVSQRQNLEQLSAKVREMKANFGVAFDGDGDRIAFVDDKGDMIWPDHILGLLYSLMNQPRTVYDLRISRAVKRWISKGVPCRVGYAFIKKEMRERGAELGGELSGHFYFKDMHYSESPMLVMLKIMISLLHSEKTLSEIMAPFRANSFSGEINIELKDEKAKEKIFENLKNKYSDGYLNEMDGVMIEYPDWWFNIRASNTEPVVRLVVEADTVSLMKEKTEELKSLIEHASASE